MKRIICLLLTAFLLLTAGTAAASAEQISEEPVTRDPGYCGENVRWSYAEGVLTLEGSGRMDDFYAGQPWQDYRSEIREVRLEGSITYLGAYAFPDYDGLKTVDFGDSLTEVGQGAFSGCDSLDHLAMPGSFRIFGEESFSHCKSLKRIEFQGGFPKFKLNCLWDTYTKLIYPAERPWPVELVQQLEEAFQGRIEFLSSDGTDPYMPEEKTEVPSEETEEAPATKPETVPATEAAEAVTEASTEMATEETAAETEEQTEAAETPAEETLPAATEEYVQLPEASEEEKGGFSLGLAAALAVMVLSGGGAIYVISRLTGNKRRDFTGDFSEVLLEDERKRPGTTASRKTKSGSKGRKGGKYRR